MKELGIEAKLEKLMAWMRAIHERFEMHEWIKDYRPWNANAANHSIYWITCACGVERAATKDEYNTADEKSDGY